VLDHLVAGYLPSTLKKTARFKELSNIIGTCVCAFDFGKASGTFRLVFNGPDEEIEVEVENGMHLADESQNHFCIIFGMMAAQPSPTTLISAAQDNASD
jgi:hypothetical protein